MRARISFFFEMGAWGWSEGIHSMASTLNDAGNHAVAYAQFRNPMLPSAARISYIRVSDDDVPRDSVVSAPPAGGYGTGTANAENAFNSYLIRMFSNALVRRSMYIRPTWGTDGLNGDRSIDSAGFIAAETSWANHIATSGFYGINHVTRTGGFARVIAAVNLGSFLQVETNGGVFIPGSRAVISQNTSQPKLNGNYLVREAPGQNIYVLSNWDGTEIDSVPNGAIQAYSNVLHPIISVTRIRIVSRKTGRPFDSPRGRSPTAT